MNSRYGGGGNVTGDGNAGLGPILSAEVSDAVAKRATYGGSAADSMSQAICNPDGTIVFCGSTSSSDKDLDGAGSAANCGWVTKIGTDGEIMWTTKSSQIGGGTITATADGGYLTAGGTTLTKLDADGKITWSYRFPGSYSDSHVNNAFLMQDGSGNVFLSIQSYDYSSIKDGRGGSLGGNPLGGRDTIMMVVDPTVDPNTDYNGFEKKAYRLGGSTNEQIAMLSVTSDGGYIGGNYTTSRSGIEQSNNDGTKKYPPTNIIGNGSHEAYIVKFDKNGDAEKVLLYGDDSPVYNNEGENITQIIELSNGGYLAVGTAALTDTTGKVPPKMGGHGGKDIWLLKLDQNLNPIWSRTYGSSANDAGYRAVETEKGYVIAGRVGAIDADVTPKAGYSGASAWVFMIDKEKGDLVWEEVHGGEGSDTFNFIAADENGDILLGGNSTSTTADLDGKNKGGNDAWFLKLSGETGASAPASGGTGGSAGGPSYSINTSPSIRLQVGAGCQDTYQIGYADMRTKTIFGADADLNVMNFNVAVENDEEENKKPDKDRKPNLKDKAVKKVLDLCDRALNYVSEQRSRYGAYQNALEHLYNSNAVTSENLSASDSRIADADMAKEMADFSRGKILEQANAAMMAQANTANNAVFKLLDI